MRAFVPFALFAALLTGCPAADEATKEDEVEALKKRVTRLETRLRQIEGRLGKPGAGKPGAGKPGAPRGKAPGGKAPEAPTGPTRELKVEGDAKAVMLTGAQRRYRIPGQVPAGDYRVLAAFGEDPLAPKGTLTVPPGETALTVSCTQAADSCTLKP